MGAYPDTSHTIRATSAVDYSVRGWDPQSATSAILSRLVDVTGDTDREPGDDPPKLSTVQRAAKLLLEIGDQIEEFPIPDVYDFDGSIRLVWQTERGALKVTVFPETRWCIYFRKAAQHGVLDNPEAHQLLESLRECL
jgi:hypothetical protein